MRVSPGVRRLSWRQQTGQEEGKEPDGPVWERAGAARRGTSWRCFEQEICEQVVILTTGTNFIIFMVLLGSPGRRVGG